MNFRIFHPRRSGGHAIIFWLLDSSLSYSFYNSIALGSRTPKLPRHRTAGKAANVFWSHEDPNRLMTLAKSIQFRKVSWLPRPDEDVFILRDFYNNAASKIRMQGKSPSASSAWRDGDSVAWTEFAELYFKNPEKFILFNKWLDDDAYRSSVAARYGFAAAEYKPDVSDYGGGSSFTGVKKQLCKSALVERYVGMEKSILPFCNSRIHELNEEIFGWRIE
jgi:hypothetical protein